MSIARQEFARRRRNLMAHMEENSIAILSAAPERTRNRDVEYPYRQDSDFWYLSGFPEPGAVMALIPGREHGEFVLFCVLDGLAVDAAVHPNIDPDDGFERSSRTPEAFGCLGCVSVHRLDVDRKRVGMRLTGR